MTTEANTCPKCGKKKRTRNALSFTQWILDQASCACDLEPLNASVSSVPATEFCKNCGKAVDGGRQGSMTQWIFRDVTCKCGQSVKPVPVAATTVVEEDVETEDEEELALDKTRFPVERYKPLKELGVGGSGTVYLCRDRILQKKVAVKTLHQLTAEQLINFQTEARATSKLNHPGILSLIDFGPTESGTPYMVLEYFPGMTLEHYLNEHGVLSPDEFSHVFEQISSALSNAHANGIFHRDLKPSNILVRFEGDKLQVKLIDFGVAKVKQETMPTITMQGNTLAGTPAYMAPDMVQGGRFDARSEIYSLGCVLFECLTGRPPFQGTTSLEVLGKHVSMPTPTLADASDDEFPTALEELVSACLAKNPDDRIQTMDDFRACVISVDLNPEDHIKFETKPAASTAPAATSRASVLLMISALLLVAGASAWYVTTVLFAPSKSDLNVIEHKEPAVPKYNEEFVPEKDIGLFKPAVPPEGDPKILVEEANIYYYGRGTKRDLPKAFALFKRAADAGDPAAQESAAYMLQEGIGVNKNLKEAFELYKKSALAGNAAAQMNLGTMYREGQGTKKDYQEALKWTRKAAAQGSSRAMNNIGYMYERGYGLPKDYKESLNWYNKAGQAGEGMAFVNAGYLYESGTGVKKDYKEAARLYGLGSKLNIAAGDRSLACLYVDGLGVKQDLNKAFKLFTKAAAKRDATAERWLGYMYLNGRGVKQDLDQAFKLFSDAGGQEDVQSQFEVGEFYDLGKGSVKADKAEALEWYRMAGNGGSTKAMLRVGFFYEIGIADAKDLKVAEQWYQAAIDKGDVEGYSYLGHIFEERKDLKKAVATYQKGSKLGSYRCDRNMAILYLFGRGVEKNYDEAFRLFSKPTVSGDVAAQRWLSEMYLNGWGVKKDLKKAFEYMLKSAKQDSPISQKILANMYEKGIGTERDHEESLKWAKRAAKNPLQ